jgi:hypothetical protein
MSHEDPNQPPAIEAAAPKKGESAFESSHSPTPEDVARSAALEERRQRSQADDQAAIGKVRAELGLTDDQPAASEDWKYGPEAIRQEIQHKVGMIRDWGRKSGLREGHDFQVIESIRQVAPEGDTIQPHEDKQFFVGVQEEQYGKFRDYILGEYARDRQAETGGRAPSLYYSWGGRFAVGGDGASFFDTVGMADAEQGVVKSRHDEFKQFFQD